MKFAAFVNNGNQTSWLMTGTRDEAIEAAEDWIKDKDDSEVVWVTEVEFFAQGKATEDEAA